MAICYDPRVSLRIMRGEAISAADYIDLLQARKSLIARTTVRMAPYDAVVMPTTAEPAHRRSCRRQGLYQSQPVGAAQLYIDQHDRGGCAISLPCHREGEVPVSLMLASWAIGSLFIRTRLEGVIRV